MLKCWSPFAILLQLPFLVRVSEAQGCCVVGLIRVLCFQEDPRSRYEDVPFTSSCSVQGKVLGCLTHCQLHRSVTAVVSILKDFPPIAVDDSA